MTLTYRVDAAHRLVYSRGWGVLTAAEVGAHSRRLAGDPRFDQHGRQVIDFRDVTTWAMSTADLRAAASQNPWGSGARRAAVVSGDAPFGITRQYELQRTLHGDEYRVYRAWAAALEWLGLPVDWSPPAACPEDPVFELAPGAG